MIGKYSGIKITRQPCKSKILSPDQNNQCPTVQYGVQRSTCQIPYLRSGFKTDPYEALFETHWNQIMVRISIQIQFNLLKLLHSYLFSCYVFSSKCTILNQFAFFFFKTKSKFLLFVLFWSIRIIFMIWKFVKTWEPWEISCKFVECFTYASF